MAPKRKTNASIGYTDSAGASPNKRSKLSKPTPKAVSTTLPEFPSFTQSTPLAASPNPPLFDHTRPEERSGIVQRKYYPAEMSNERCAMYNSGDLPKPIDVLHSTLSSSASTRATIPGGKAVVHWFKRDLRITDNKGLSLAGKKARALGVPLITMFVLSVQDYEAHSTGAARVDFERRTLEVLRGDLAALDIPLYCETVEKRRSVPGRIVELCGGWGARHLFCNIEYEVDELRREEKLVRLGVEKEIDVSPVHDDVVVEPGTVRTGAGKHFAVFSPWCRAWIKHIHAHPQLLDEWPSPSSNPPSARKSYAPLFTSSIPPAPQDKQLSPARAKKLSSLWPAGEHEALSRLDKFLSEKIVAYKDTRNFPFQHSTALLSVHHATGTLSARTSIRLARARNKTTSLDAGHPGIVTWISEVGWRDFYKTILCFWPYICMHKPFKYEYTNIEWEYNNAHFQAWCAGKTGFPIVDAAMRQLHGMHYMHNRCRMIVASFLAKDLLLDWRLGERFFMQNLIDCDFASNSGGWGFSASVGVDPQPYFRIFNPLLQSEKFDSEGEYIRKWVPELREVEGKAIHDPWGRGAAKLCEKNGYPKPIVDHAVCRKRALERYKAGIGRETA